jgi:hypothetical protein
MTTALAAILAAVAFPGPTVPAATVTLSPASARGGSTISITGIGFPARAPVSFRPGGQRLSTLKVNRRGEFSTVLVVPKALRFGRTVVLVQVGRQRLRIPLQVVSKDIRPGSSLTTSRRGERVLLSPAAGQVGKTLRLRGTAFSGRRIQVQFGKLRRTVPVRRGTFFSSVVVPNIRPGVHMIVVRSPHTLLRVPVLVLKRGVSAPTGDGPDRPRTPSHPGASSPRVIVDLPFSLDFSRDHGGLVDRAGIGTGFTYSPRTEGTGYIPSELAMDIGAGTLRIAATKGIAYRKNNTLDNALAVGLKASKTPFRMSTTIRRPPPGTRQYEQGGLWIGSDQDNYLKLVVISMRRGGTKIQALLEVNGVVLAALLTPPLSLSDAAVSLVIHAAPATGQLVVSYEVDGAPGEPLGSFTVPDRFFNLDPTRIDPILGTSGFVGIFASKRLGVAAARFVFDEFSVTPG